MISTGRRRPSRKEARRCHPGSASRSRPPSAFFWLECISREPRAPVRGLVRGYPFISSSPHATPARIAIRSTRYANRTVQVRPSHSTPIDHAGKEAASLMFDPLFLILVCGIALTMDGLRGFRVPYKVPRNHAATRASPVSYIAPKQFLSQLTPRVCAGIPYPNSSCFSPAGPGFGSIAAASTTLESEPFVAAGAWFFLSGYRLITSRMPSSSESNWRRDIFSPARRTRRHITDRRIGPCCNTTREHALWSRSSGSAATNSPCEPSSP